jgi:hypothetical protein
MLIVRLLDVDIHELVPFSALGTITTYGKRDAVYCDQMEVVLVLVGHELLDIGIVPLHFADIIFFLSIF